MKKAISFILILTFFTLNSITVFADFDTKYRAEQSDGFYGQADIDLECEVGGAYLCEASTGKVLYAYNEFHAASPASVTKIMTLLLVCEALDEGRFTLEDSVRISAHAASMGGSQVFLKEGEKVTVEELIKATVIASGNDSSVALAELTCGSEKAFVKRMNERASELGLKMTNFENATGLDDTTVDHYSCAGDIAKMSTELIKHKIILQYSSLWQDSIRNGEFILTNTNRLVRYYDGCNGLKTGSTDKAGYCISASAKRGNMQLVAVIMGAKTKEERNNAARILLDYGFSNYALYERPEEYIEEANIYGGTKNFAPLYRSGFSIVVERNKLNLVEEIFEIPESLSAPINEGDQLGKVIYKIGDEQLGFSLIYTKESIKKISISEIFTRIIKRVICG